jgi:hypothetical protein
MVSIISYRSEMNYHNILRIATKFSKLAEEEEPEEGLEEEEEAEPSYDWEAEEKRADQEVASLVQLVGSEDRVVLSPGEIGQVRIPDQKLDKKPKGIWYACGPEWLQWMTGEGSSSMIDVYNYIYTISVGGRNVLNINGLDELKAFYDRYGQDVDIMDLLRTRSIEDLRNDPPELGPIIDWTKVARDYDGIEICPYIPRSNDRPYFYDGWDIASGCIWAPRGVKNIRLIAKRDENGVWDPVVQRRRVPR